MRVSSETKKSLPLLLSSFVCAVIFFLFIPPQNAGIVALFFFFIFLFIYSLSRLFLPKRFSLLCSSGVISLLLLGVFGAFDTINSILLISLFVGIFALIK